MLQSVEGKLIKEIAKMTCKLHNDCVEEKASA